MLYLEESLDSILSEEGQTLLGLPFLVDTLDLSMQRIELLFKKSALEYSQRKPIKETRIFSGNPIIMPEGTMAVRAVRYGVLPELPRFYMNDFGVTSYEFEKHTRILKVWPPIYPLKITYDRTLNVTRDSKINLTESLLEGDDLIYLIVPCTPRDNSISISKGDAVMTQTGSHTVTVEGYLGPEVQTIIDLSGTLGTGTINTATKEMELELLDTTAGTLECNFNPKYYVIEEIGLEDYVFNKLFASKLLEALASLRAQATQEVLHNIDLTTDDLYARVRELKRELRVLLRNTINFSGMAGI